MTDSPFYFPIVLSVGFFFHETLIKMKILIKRRKNLVLRSDSNWNLWHSVWSFWMTTSKKNARLEIAANFQTKAHSRLLWLLNCFKNYLLDVRSMKKEKKIWRKHLISFSFNYYNQNFYNNCVMTALLVLKLFGRCQKHVNWSRKENESTGRILKTMIIIQRFYHNHV